MLVSCTEILIRANIEAEVFDAKLNILVTPANQLVGTYADLEKFRDKYTTKEGEKIYAGWEIHHIVEDQDLYRTGIADKLPEYRRQLCVLIPDKAHRKRINQMLRNRNPTKFSANAEELIEAYGEAYELVGDYAGGAEGGVQSELTAIVEATFRAANALPAGSPAAGRKRKKTEAARTGR